MSKPLWGQDSYVSEYLSRYDLMLLGRKFDLVDGGYNFPRGVPDPKFEQWLEDDRNAEAECYKEYYRSLDNKPKEK